MSAEMKCRQKYVGIMFFVYVLRSVVDKKLYIGFTSNLKKRVDKHNSKEVKSTRDRVPFKLIYYESYINEEYARKRERKLKKMGSKRETLKKELEKTLKDN